MIYKSVKDCRYFVILAPLGPVLVDTIGCYLVDMSADISADLVLVAISVNISTDLSVNT